MTERLKTIEEVETKNPDCPKCAGSGWVCENHADRPWEGFSSDARVCQCGGAGMPCQVCNALWLHQFRNDHVRN